MSSTNTHDLPPDADTGDVASTERHSDTGPNMASENEKSQDVEAGGLSLPLEDSTPPPRTVIGFKWILLVSAILSSTFLFALDNTITANIQPAVVDRFNAVDRLPWISVAYLLGAASINLFWGQLYTRLDAKWTYIACVLVFEAGSALCGGAPNMAAFIVGRTLCGLFGSGMYVGAMVLIALTTYEHERSTYFGLVGITWGFGTVMGPIIGGALADANAWRWAFYLNLCVGAVAGPVYIFLIPSKDPLPGSSYTDRLAPIDKLGTFLLAGALTSLLMGISFGGVVYEWDSATTIALFVVAGVLFLMFAAQQVFTVLTTVETRLFPLQFLRSPIMVMLGLTAAASATASFVVIYFIPLLYQLVAGESALTSGVHLLPFVCFMVTICVGNGILVGKYGYYMPWCLASGIFILIGSACLITVNEHTPAANIYGYTILYGIGVGATIQMPFSVAQAKAKPEEGGLAIGYCTCFQFVGPAVSLSMANSVFLNEAIGNIKEILPGLGKQTILGALFGLNPEILNGNELVPHAAITHAIASAMKNVYAIPVSSGILILVMSLFMKREKLFGMIAVPGA